MKRVKTICIIDDDPVFIFGAKKLIKNADFCDEILHYENAENALEDLKYKIAKQPEKIPEVILLDLNMPVMDGWNFMDEFIKVDCPKKITIFIVTSSIDPADALRVKEYSETVQDYIIKPITKEDLLTMLKQA
ncbi:MAG: response regulator [Leeuwenhoekiella sp.]